MLRFYQSESCWGTPREAPLIFQKKRRKNHRNIFLYKEDALYLLYNQLKQKNMKKFNIAVLDFGTLQVAMYTGIELDKELDPEAEETFIIDQGHNLNNCQWMISENEIDVEYY